MSNETIFAQRLREARLRTGLSQKALGIQAGIDQFSASPRMNQYERGKHLPDLLTMEHLAHAAKVPVAFFFAKENELAELLGLWGSLDQEARAALLVTARQLVDGTEPR